MKMKKKRAMIIVFMIIIIPGVYFTLFQNDENAGNLEESEKGLFHEILAGAEEFESLDTNDKQNGINYIYAGFSEGSKAGYVVSVTKEGYRKDIRMIIGVDAKERVCGIKIISQKETKGKGSLIEGEGFLKQYIGQSSEDLSVQAISGATISSEAVEQGVKTALDAVSELTRK